MPKKNFLTYNHKLKIQKSERGVYLMKRVLKCFSKFLMFLIVFTLTIWYNEIAKAGEVYEQENNNSFSTANTINFGDFVKGLIYSIY